MMRKLLTLTFTFIVLFSFAQQEPLDRSLEGYWTGALIRSGNSVQIMHAEIYPQGDSLMIATSIPDWAHYPARKATLKREGSRISFDTYYGEVDMLLDSGYMEMTGTVQEAVPTYNIHLKKSLKPPFIPKIRSEDIAIENKGANISGTLYYPEHIEQPMAAAVIVHGRGCAPRRWKTNRAQLMARYGLATFVHDKRGSDPSGFPCEEATHDLNVSDIKAILQKVAAHEVVDDKKLGLISYSAGGWIVPHVARESEVPVAFLITIVGPTTSVLQQQIDGLQAFLEEQDMSEQAIAEATQYTQLMFSKRKRQAAFKEMQALIKKGDRSGWTDWLVEDDYVKSPDAFDDLWVQRFSYDPGEDLAAFEGPYLAIFGEKDRVVPYQKQLARLEEIMPNDKANYETHVILGAYHGLEHGHLIRELPKKPNSRTPNFYYKFDRVAYGTYTYIFDFLRRYDFLQE